MLNTQAHQLFLQALDQTTALRCQSLKVADASVLDMGVNCPGSLSAGILLAKLCLAGDVEISIVPCDPDLGSHNSVHLRLDDPVRCCLGSQYAGWPVQSDDYFAMGSGPMRMCRGKEPVLEHLQLAESVAPIVGVLESDTLPTKSCIELISGECGVASHDVHIAVAPSTSIAGSLQVIARSVETAMHKLHELDFDVSSIISATGNAPLPPPAKPGDTVGGIGRTNDAILYGGTVTLWVDQDDDVLQDVVARIPSSSSSDHGQPFAKIFKQYEYDFYRVDPLLFSPAVVTLHNLRSGRTWTAGKIEPALLRESFLS